MFPVLLIGVRGVKERRSGIRRKPVSESWTGGTSAPLPPSFPAGQQARRLRSGAAGSEAENDALFDEPTSALTLNCAMKCWKVMQDLAEEGMAPWSLSPRNRLCQKVASRLIFIDKGRAAEDGSPQALIENPLPTFLQEFYSTFLRYRPSCPRQEGIMNSPISFSLPAPSILP